MEGKEMIRGMLEEEDGVGVIEVVLILVGILTTYCTVCIV